MDFLIENIFRRLPKEIKDLPETPILWNILRMDKKFDYREFAYGIEEWENNADDVLGEWSQSIENRKETKWKDYRIRKYSIAHFRKFDDKNGFPYILNLLDEENHFCSLFLAGKNGSGKTSLFTGLEYMFTHEHISMLEYRNIVDQEKEQYFPYGNRKESDIEIELEFNGQDDNDNYIRTIDPLKIGFSFQPFFCCDAELSAIQKENNLMEVFLDNLGLSKVKQLLMDIDNAILYFQKRMNRPITENQYSEEWLETLQDDVLQIAGLTHNSYDNVTKNLLMIKGYMDKNMPAQFTGFDDEDFKAVLALIEKVKTFWNLYCKNSSLLFFKQRQKIVENYEMVATLSENSLAEAMLIYETLPSITNFANECYAYNKELLDVFKIKEYKKRRKQALAALERYIKGEDEIKRNILWEKEIESIKMNENHIENLLLIKNGLNDIYEDEVSKVEETCQNTVVPILNEFTHLDKQEAKLTTEQETIFFKKEDGQLKAYIRNEHIFGSVKKVTPKNFYNSFRYKLYAISIKVAMAFMTMKIRNVYAPLVFDDVFTASDFDNSINIDRFFYRIFETFEKLEIGKKEDLQIILFSHDEVVLNCISSVEAEMNIRLIKGILLRDDMIENQDFLETEHAYPLYETC